MGFLAEARLICVECETWADSSATGWEAYLVGDDGDGPDEVLIYCPRCAQREFHEREGEGD